MSDRQTTSRPRRKKKKKIDKLRLAIIVGLVLLVLFPIRQVVTLQMERQELKKENAQLIAQRDSLKKELKRVDSKEYIEERAKEQLRLVNPDEILFVFPDDEEDND